jgi:hypothetical protein
MKKANIFILILGSVTSILLLQNTRSGVFANNFNFNYLCFSNSNTEELIFSLSPNPVQLGQILTISFTEYNNKSNITVKVLDVIGNKTYSKEYHPDKSIELSINSEKFRSGIYILEVEQGNIVVRKRINVIE